MWLLPHRIDGTRPNGRSHRAMPELRSDDYVPSTDTCISTTASMAIPIGRRYSSPSAAAPLDEWFGNALFPISHRNRAAPKKTAWTATFNDLIRPGFWSLSMALCTVVSSRSPATHGRINNWYRRCQRITADPWCPTPFKPWDKWPRWSDLAWQRYPSGPHQPSDSAHLR